MKIALDTNVLAYAEGVDDPEKRRIAMDLIRALPDADVVIPIRVFGELFDVLVRRAGRSFSPPPRGPAAGRFSPKTCRTASPGGGVTLANPFASPCHETLVTLMSSFGGR